LFFLAPALPPPLTLFPYTTLFRSRFRKPRAAPQTALPSPARDGARGSRTGSAAGVGRPQGQERETGFRHRPRGTWQERRASPVRSEEHTSELQSPDHLVCRLLLEK